MKTSEVRNFLRKLGQRGNENMLNNNDVDNLVSMLDGMMEGGVSRLKLDVSEEIDSGSIEKKYHHGRCDVGSPFATGKLYDFEDSCD